MARDGEGDVECGCLPGECVPLSIRENKQLCCGGSACCGCLFLLIFILSSLRSVPAGHLGLAVTFGNPSEDLQSPGMHVLNPFARVKQFSVKTTLYEQTNTVPTAEGLTVGLDVGVLFRLQPKKIYDVYTTIGEDFIDVLISPLLASLVRGLTSQSEAKDLYGAQRALLQSNLTIAMEEALAPRGVLVEKVLLRSVLLPAQLKASIEAKAQAEQDAKRMEFVLQKEKQEADRKKIEAKGIADFQRIVTEGITPSLLQWKGIEATEKFALSKNSKLVIMGNTKASLPVMMSGDVE